MKDDSAKRKKTSLAKKVTALMAALVALLGGVAGILKNSEEISSWIRRQSPKDSYEVRVKYANVVPSYLKYYYDAEGLGKKQSLYWFRATLDNRTNKSLYLALSFRLLPSDCKFVVLESKDPVEYSLGPGESKVEEIRPPLEFMKHDAEGECYLQINWVVENKQQDQAYKRADVAKIRLLPLHTMKWDLLNPDGKPVAPEFLLASLAGWARSRDGKVIDEAKLLKTRAGSSSEDRWLELCYEDLFHGQSAISITHSDRTYPFVGEKSVAVASQVLSEKDAEPLEAGLLMASIMQASSISRHLHLSIFVVPHGENAREPEVFLAWTVANDHWAAVNLREAVELGFKANKERSTEALKRVFDQEPELEHVLKEQGVFIGSGPSSLKAVSFDGATEKFKIRPLD